MLRQDWDLHDALCPPQRSQYCTASEGPGSNKSTSITSRTIVKLLLKMLLKLVRECRYPQWNKSCTGMDWKVTQPGKSQEKLLQKKQPPPLDYSLQMQTGIDSFIFGDMSSSLMKLKFVWPQWLLWHLEEKKNKNQRGGCQPENVILTVKNRDGSITLWCTLQNRWGNLKISSRKLKPGFSKWTVTLSISPN